MADEGHVAIHEAGHAVVTFVLNQRLPGTGRAFREVCLKEGDDKTPGEVVGLLITHPMSKAIIEQYPESKQYPEAAILGQLAGKLQNIQ